MIVMMVMVVMIVMMVMMVMITVATMMATMVEGNMVVAMTVHEGDNASDEDGE